MNTASQSLKLAVTQMSCTWDTESNCDTAEVLVRDAAASGAQLILLQELFETPYFCAAQSGQHFKLARTFVDNELLARFADLAKVLNVVLPISYFEKTARQYFNSVAVIDADGSILGNYRKSHIPDGPGYQEKFYFTPGNSGFRTFDTAAGCIGVAICWDQWFPECARSMALQGADILLYPTAIGSEPTMPSLDSSAHWQRTMQGHAAANMCIVAASNRVGIEQEGDGLAFYGKSFVADETGDLIVQMDDEPGFLIADVNLADLAERRASWGLFRDRRPELYQSIVFND